MKIEADLVAKQQVMPRPSAYVGDAVGDSASTISPSILNESVSGESLNISHNMTLLIAYFTRSV